MPHAILRDLVSLFESVLGLGHFPGYMALSTASCVPKVFSTLYRFFASGLACALLQSWARVMPFNIYGALPGRSSRDAALALGLQVESALDVAEPLQGYSIDLSRFFNTVPRAPTLFLMHHLGAPASLLRMWGGFLQRSFRHPVLNGHYGAAVPSSKGIPEGGPLSVAAQVALNWMLISFVQVQGLQILTFIDNWSFVAASLCAMLESLLLVQQFCALLCLTISWPKSYAWATSSLRRQHILAQLPRVVPGGCTLSVVSSVKDLGVVFRFRQGLSRGAAQDRLNSAYEKLARLEAMPRSIGNKLQLLQQAIWPGRLVAVQEVDGLRSAAARLLAGVVVTRQRLLCQWWARANMSPKSTCCVSLCEPWPGLC